MAVLPRPVGEEKVRKIFLATIVLGLVSFAAFVLERLALTDIFHGETDLRFEWAIVHMALPPVVLFHLLGIASAVLALFRLGRRGKGNAA